MSDTPAYQAACAAIDRITRAWAKAASLEAIRSGFEGFLQEVGGPLPADVIQQGFTLNGLDACWFTPANIVSHKPVLYCHGGGFQIGSIRSHASLMARLARATGLRILGFDYRLAPEHRAPHAADDGWMVYRWLIDQGDTPLALAGDSAGGALALITALKAREARIALPQALVLLSPWLDLSLSGASYRDLADLDRFSKPEQLRAMARTYAGRGVDLTDPALSPVFASLEALPEILIHAGGDDITVDDSRLLAHRAKDTGTRVQVEIFDKMFHHFQVFADLPETNISLEQIGSFLKGHAAKTGPFA